MGLAPKTARLTAFCDSLLSLLWRLSHFNNGPTRVDLDLFAAPQEKGTGTVPYYRFWLKVGSGTEPVPFLARRVD